MKLITLLLLALVSPGAQPSAVDASARAASIRGTITVRAAAPKKVANRYAGAGSGAAQKLQPMAAVVYLRGTGLTGRADATTEMAQRDTAFAPNIRVVTTGSEIEFRNRDPFFHNVFSYSKAKRFDLGRFPTPESKTVKFESAGVVNIFCEIHKSMRAVVLVVDNPYHAVVADDGSYEIRDVPPGTYELVVWHVDNGTKTMPVTVPATGSVRVDATL
jgi:plastocyanin